MSVTSVTSSNRAVTNLSLLRGASSGELARAETKRLRLAAEIIANAAKAIAARFSKRIPKSIRVTSTGKAIWIVADGAIAPNAYPFEMGSDHPLFGNRSYWYKMDKKPFLEEAAATTADEALVAFSAVVDDWVKQLKL